ncbi:MAG: CPBP family intramembrane metalloprotease [Deltaproteobacteria bacterium]|nr:CPBP family intramembrane metalloprotease [Deltaproteobacteria bacterium]
MDTPSVPAPAPSPAPTAGMALALLAVSAFAAVVLGSLMQLASLPLGLLWTEAFTFFAPAWLLVCAFRGDPASWLGLSRPRPLHVALGFLVGLANYPLAGTLEVLVRTWVEARWPAISKFFDLAAHAFGNAHGWQKAVIVLAVVLAAPLGEETMFRGVLQPSLARSLRPAGAIAITAALFSLIHLDPIGFLARMELGIVFGLLVFWTRSLWVSMAAHAANNLFATGLYFVAGDAKDEAPPEKLQLLGLFALGVVLTAPLLYAAWRSRRPVEPQPWTPPADLSRQLRGWTAAAIVSAVAMVLVAWATHSLGQIAR